MHMPDPSANPWPPSGPISSLLGILSAFSALSSIFEFSGSTSSSPAARKIAQGGNVSVCSGISYSFCIASSWGHPNSHKASEIIRAKIRANGGRVVVHTARGLPCEIIASPDGHSFTCDKLPIKPPYQFEVFDIIVNMLLANNGRARKGNGRNYRLGEPECDETTVVGAIGYNYSGKTKGSSVYDPVFVLSAVLDWAGIANNERGEIALTASYLSAL